MNMTGQEGVEAESGRQRSWDVMQLHWSPQEILRGALELGWHFRVGVRWLGFYVPILIEMGWGHWVGTSAQSHGDRWSSSLQLRQSSKRADSQGPSSGSALGPWEISPEFLKGNMGSTSPHATRVLLMYLSWFPFEVKVSETQKLYGKLFHKITSSQTENCFFGIPMV